MEQIILVVHLVVALAIIGLIMLQQGKGADAGAALNAANEHAVAMFMDARLPFGQIDRCVEHVMSSWDPSPIASLDDVLAADERARALADAYCTTKGMRVS